MLPLVLALHTAVSLAGVQGADVEEALIIVAAVHDPYLLRLCGGQIEIAGRTRLSGLHAWVPEKSDLSFGAQIQRDDTHEAFPIPFELIQSARARNRSAVSLRGIRPPPASAWQGRRNPDVAYWQRVSLSRPGISQDRSKAIVAIEELTIGPEGYTVYLEKRGGVWVVVGHGAHWIV
jgi:hypothetical protein